MWLDGLRCAGSVKCIQGLEDLVWKKNAEKTVNNFFDIKVPSISPYISSKVQSCTYDTMTPFFFPATSVPLSWWKAWILNPCISVLWMTEESCTSLPRMGLFVRWTWNSFLSLFRQFIVRSMFLTTQLDCHIKFSLWWNLRFYIAKKLIVSGRNLRFQFSAHRS